MEEEEGCGRARPKRPCEWGHVRAERRGTRKEQQRRNAVDVYVGCEDDVRMSVGDLMRCEAPCAPGVAGARQQPRRRRRRRRRQLFPASCSPPASITSAPTHKRAPTGTRSDIIPAHDRNDSLAHLPPPLEHARHQHTFESKSPVIRKESERLSRRRRTARTPHASLTPGPRRPIWRQLPRAL